MRLHKAGEGAALITVPPKFSRGRESSICTLHLPLGVSGASGTCQPWLLLSKPSRGAGSQTLHSLVEHGVSGNQPRGYAHARACVWVLGMQAPGVRGGSRLHGWVQVQPQVSRSEHQPATPTGTVAQVWPKDLKQQASLEGTTASGCPRATVLALPSGNSREEEPCPAELHPSIPTHLDSGRATASWYAGQLQLELNSCGE